MKNQRSNCKNKLLKSLADEYPVGEKFVNAYLEYLCEHSGQAIDSEQDIENLPSPWSEWLKSALGVNFQGEEIYSALKPYLPEKGKKYFDIGCGFGGRLVAFALKGFQVKGIEANPLKAKFAKANSEDFGVEEGILEIDYFSEDLESLGQFDVIACVNELEYFSDLDNGSQLLVNLLNPGGVLYLQSNNYHSLQNIASDPHFGLFGVALLEPEDFKEYYSCFSSEACRAGIYRTLHTYRNAFESRSCSVEVVPSLLYDLPEMDKCENKVISLLEAFQAFLSLQKAPKKEIPEYIRRKIALVFRHVMGGMIQDLAWTAGGEFDSKSFRLKYLANSWSMIVRKPS